jgi:hypothetical protein
VKKTHFMFVCFLFCGHVCAGEESFGPFNFDGGHITCKSFSGDEIKKWQTYRATNDRFFKENSINVKVISGYAPKGYKCEVSAIRKQNIKVMSDAGEIEVSVVKEFDVFAGADCGTDVSRFAGKTASVECEVSATLVKFTNK